MAGRDLCVGPITHLENSYRVCGLYECDIETSTMNRPRSTRNCKAMEKNEFLLRLFQVKIYLPFISGGRAVA